MLIVGIRPSRDHRIPPAGPAEVAVRRIPELASAFLIVNGGILFAAECSAAGTSAAAPSATLRSSPTRTDDPAYEQIEGLSLRTTVIVGFFQAGALLPGISRSGITMAAGLVAGLRHEEAARFSFLLATPIILAAGLLELPDLGSDAPTLLVAIGAAALVRVGRLCQRPFPAPLPPLRTSRPLRVLLCGSRGRGPRLHPLTVVL